MERGCRCQLLLRERLLARSIIQSASQLAHVQSGGNADARRRFYWQIVLEGGEGASEIPDKCSFAHYSTCPKLSECSLDDYSRVLFLHSLVCCC